MPATGKWSGISRIAAWPAHMTHDKLAEAEQANYRIVALGDDLTYSADNRAESWPALLEEELNSKLRKKKRQVTVINAGIPGSTSREAFVRLARDMTPFDPQLVIFSFLFADSLLIRRKNGDGWRDNSPLEEAEKSMEKLCRELVASPAKILFWTPNPAFPHDIIGDHETGPARQWADAQQARKSHLQAHAVHLAKIHGIPVLNIRSRFEVAGLKSARKWMQDWYRHNPAGARNIATWMAGYILEQGLLP
jgi:lysophospholipase L1-like esterase